MVKSWLKEILSGLESFSLESVAGDRSRVHHSKARTYYAYSGRWPVEWSTSGLKWSRVVSITFLKEKKSIHTQTANIDHYQMEKKFPSIKLWLANILVKIFLFKWPEIGTNRFVSSNGTIFCNLKTKKFWPEFFQVKILYSEIFFFHICITRCTRI